MSKPQIHLFVQEGCRPCHYVQTQLSKIHDWEKTITVTDSKCCGEWTDFAKASGVVATPTLVAFEAGEVVARQAAVSATSLSAPHSRLRRLFVVRLITLCSDSLVSETLS